MDFDFNHITVPFRMQPGLARLPAGADQLTPLRPDSRLRAEKAQVVAAGAARQCVPGFDPGPALESIAARPEAARARSLLPPETPLELQFEEDFAVLDGDTGQLLWLSVCVPSHWAPEDKIGLPLAAVHAPVADAAMLQAASGHLTQLVTSGGCWERFVWTASPSPRHDQHPKRHARTPWPAADDIHAFGASCFLRAERQTFFPVGRGTRQAVFTIRVMVAPLAQAVDTTDKARRMHDSIASMSEAVLAYKGLAAARAPLLAWLSARAAG